MRHGLLFLVALTGVGLLSNAPVRGQDKVQQDIDSSLRLLTSQRSTDRAFAAGVLGLVGERAKDVASGPLCAAVLDGDPSVRSAAGRALGTVNAALQQPVVTLATSQDYAARLKALQDLGRLGNTARPTIPVLLSFKQQAKPEDRTSVIRILTQVGAEDPMLTDVFASWLLDDPDENVRVAVAQSLPKMKNAQGKVDTLVKSIEKDRLHKVRAASVTALGVLGIGNPQANRVLEGLQRDLNPEVRAAAQEALKKVRMKK